MRPARPRAAMCVVYVLCCWAVLTPAPAAGSTTGPDVTAIAQQISAIYAVHAPNKLGKVPGLLQKYAGAEDALLLSVKEKYGVSDAPQTAPLTPPPPSDQAGGTEGQDPGVPVGNAGTLADLSAAVGQLHARKLGIGDMRGFVGDAALPEFRRRWGAAPMLAKTVHDPSSISQFFSTSAMHALLAGNKAPKSVYARDGFDFDKNAIPSASPTSPPSPFAVYLAVRLHSPLPFSVCAVLLFGCSWSRSAVLLNALS